MEFDFDKELEECKKKVKDDESIVYAIGLGRIAPKLGMMKQQEKAVKFISGLKGFKGFHPVDLWHTLAIFDTLNNAKGARNLMRNKGIQMGNHIVPIMVKNEYLKNDNNV